jgi:WD40 repeat protein
MQESWCWLAALGCTLLAGNLTGQVQSVGTIGTNKFSLIANALGPAPEPLKRNELHQQEAAKVKSAKGPWQQVVAIESFDHWGDPLVGDSAVSANTRTNYKPRLPNPNVIAFLDNRRLLVADGAHPIRVFDADTGALLKSFGDPLAQDGSGRRNIAVSPEGRFVMILPDATPKIWDTVEGTLAASLPAASNGYTHAVFCDDGRRFTTCRWADTRRNWAMVLQLWELNPVQRTALPIRKAETDGKIAYQRLLINGPHLIADAWHSVQVFDVESFQGLVLKPQWYAGEFLFPEPVLSPLQVLSREAVGRVALLDSDETVPPTKFQSGRTPRLRILSLEDGKELRDLPLPVEDDKQNRSARYLVSPGLSKLAVSQRGHLDFFNAETGLLLTSLKAGDPYQHAGARFLDEEQALVSRGHSMASSTDIVRVADGRVLASIPDGIVAFSPGGRHLAAKRNFVPASLLPESNTNAAVAFASLARPYVVLWKQTGMGVPAGK